jgi:hypothetical protein
MIEVWIIGLDWKCVDKLPETAPQVPLNCQQKSRPEAAFRYDLAG